MREPIIQLLPSMDDCRILRTALSEFVDNDNGKTVTEQDMAWALLAQITQKMRQAGIR